jgi:hypothetical protein
MSDFKMKGVLKVINPAVQVSEKFIKREFVLNEPHDQYPQDILFQLTQKNVDVLDKFGEGQEVEVSFRIRGREYNGKYFNNIEAWRVEAIGEAPKPVEVKEEEPLPF